MRASGAWLWVVVALAGALVLGLLATNRGYFGTEELDLLDELVDGPWFRLAWFGEFAQQHYRPLGDTALRSQLGIFGDEPRVIHSLSVLHHLANVGLLALLLERLGPRGRLALLALLLPVAAPGVAWAAGACDRLACTWLLAAALLLTARGALCRFALPCVLLALASKESAIAFVVPALLLAWRRRRDADRRWIFATTGAIAVVAVVFTLWRLRVASLPATATPANDSGAALELLRCLAFPFALGAADPAAVSGPYWLGGAGSLALLAIALCGAPWLALAGLACAAAPLLLGAVVPQLDADSLYLATPGCILLVAAASRCRGGAARVVLGALLALCTVQSLLLAAHYRQAGFALDNLRQAHARASGLEHFDIYCAPGSPSSIAERFVLHGEHRGLQPRPRRVQVEAPRAFVLEAEGSVRQLPQ
ncbi:MAG TPA: hypothetical protein VF384_11745 [Planctomycetota bacterium]